MGDSIQENPKPIRGEMKLQKLLEEITPLPWTNKTRLGAANYDQLKANAIYRRHAANMLPELVAAGMKMANRGPFMPLDEALEIENNFYKALARAEKVEAK
jgi:hypothetical protein